MTGKTAVLAFVLITCFTVKEYAYQSGSFDTHATRASFVAASVMPNKSGGNAVFAAGRDETFVARNVTFGMLVQYAYRLPTDQVLQVFGVPNWSFDRFDIEAKIANNGNVPSSQQQLALMVQSLLEDRFRLQIHRETRDFPVYILLAQTAGPGAKSSEHEYQAKITSSVVEKREARTQAGAGLVPSSRQDMSRFAPGGEIRSIGNDIIGNGVSISLLAGFLGQQLGFSVFDRTGLEGLFDFKLHWVPKPANALARGRQDFTIRRASDTSSGSILKAVEEIGLQLEQAKSSVDVLVIDHVEHP